MALVKCSECNNLVSNKATMCPHCGYAPKGVCRDCKWFDNIESFLGWRCRAIENEFVKDYKEACPAAIKKDVFDFSIVVD